jgi:hypothetical protein
MTNMDVDADTAAIQRIKAAEEKMAKMDIKTQQGLMSMRTEFNEKLNSILQEIRDQKNRTNVPTGEVPVEHQDQDEPQDQDEHQDRDEQAWMEDEMNRRT